MGDFIIAVVPAKGHEHLVAEGPSVDGCVPERPMTIRRCSCGVWGCPAFDGVLVGGVHHPAPQTWDVALVLHAPGDPKLGMLRAMGAASEWVCSDARVHCFRSFDGPCRAKSRHATGSSEWPLPDSTPDTLGEPSIIGTFDHPGAAAFALAHLLVQRGIAAEVIVIEPADKAKE